MLVLYIFFFFKIIDLNLCEFWRSTADDEIEDQETDFDWIMIIGFWFIESIGALVGYLIGNAVDETLETSYENMLILQNAKNFEEIANFQGLVCIPIGAMIGIICLSMLLGFSVAKCLKIKRQNSKNLYTRI